jgi:hypothetical protein
MTNSQVKYFRVKLSKSVLTLILLLSVLTFSCYSNASQLIPKRAQTELVCSTKDKRNKQTVSLKGTKSIAHRNTFSTNSNKYDSRFLLTSNSLIKVKIDNLCKKYHSFKQADKHLHLKNIPQNSTKDIFISIG